MQVTELRAPVALDFNVVVIWYGDAVGGLRDVKPVHLRKLMRYLRVHLGILARDERGMRKAAEQVWTATRSD